MAEFYAYGCVTLSMLHLRARSFAPVTHSSVKALTNALNRSGSIKRCFNPSSTVASKTVRLARGAEMLAPVAAMPLGSILVRQPDPSSGAFLDEEMRCSATIWMRIRGDQGENKKPLL